MPQLEKKVFEKFVSPNQIAVSLENKQSKDHLLAIRAMKKVEHFERYEGASALRQWYSDDFEFILRCKNIKTKYII